MLGEDKAWTEYREKFAELYDECNYGSSLQSFAMRASHRLVESPFGAESYFEKVLEIGAGTGEHLSFIRHGYKEYFMSDVEPKAINVAREKIGRTNKTKIVFEVQSKGRLSYDDNSFNRVVAVHVLEHIYKPHLAIKDWWRVLKDGGMLSILIPTDPGIAWRLGRQMGPRRNAIARGIAYDYVMAREHVNSCTNLIAIMRHYFPKGKEVWWPFPVPVIDVNLFVAFHACVTKRIPDQ